MKNEAIDRIIETTLTNDADRIRSRFASMPGTSLTSKLAIAIAPKAFFATLSAKFLLVAGTVLVAGATVYLWPTLTSHSRGADVPAAARQVPSAAAQQVHVQNSNAMAPATFTEIPKTHAKPQKNWLHLDDGGSKNVKTITNSHYEPPIK